MSIITIVLISLVATPLVYVEIVYPCIVYNNIRKALNIYRNKQKYITREKEKNNDCQ